MDERFDSKVLRVAVLFYRVGPYHFARLRAAGRQMRVTVVEFSNMDPFYAWDEVKGQEGFERAILFDGVPVEGQPAETIAARVRKVLSGLQPQVVFVPGWSGNVAFAALSWCGRAGVPAVVMSESTAWDERRVAWKEWLKRRIVGLCSAALVGGTPHRDYMEKLGLPVDVVFSGYDVVDNAYFADRAAEIRNRKSEIRNQHGLPENYFLASARFIEKKNLPRLLQAYARYRALAEKSGSGKQKSAAPHPRPLPIASQRGEGNAPWNLVLLGDGALRSGLESQVSSLGLQHCVHLPGFKQYPELPAYYGCARAFIHASTTEQWGLVVNEAMASGLPVLVSNRCGCAADLVEEGVNGYTFNPCNIEELAQLMLKVSAFEFPLAAFGSESQRIISDWGPERFARGLAAATECAFKIGPKRSGIFDRMLLFALVRR